MRKKFSLLIFVAFIILIGLIGCQSTNKDELENNSTVEQAIANGKLALADGDYVKSKSNFELALAEDKESKEAKDWLTLVEKLDLLSNHLENKDVEKAEKVISDIKTDETYQVVKSQLDNYESILTSIKSSIENIDNGIATLNQKLGNGAFEEVIEIGNNLKGEKNITENQLVTIDSIIEDATKKQDEAILAQKKDEQESKVTEKNASKPTLSLDEMRQIAKEFVDNWNGYDNILRDEWDSGDVRVYEFKDGPAERSIAVTVNYKTGEVTPDQGMY